MRSKILTLVVLVLSSAHLSFGQPGNLDSDFDSDGKVITDLGKDDKGRSLVIQPDGKIIVAGSQEDAGNSDFALMRYHTDGSIDNSFTKDGKIILDFGGNDEGWAVALQPDGKVLVAGQSDGDVALARILSNGQLDNSFGNSGKVTTDFGGLNICWSLAVQADGKILVAGISAGVSDADVLVARYNTNGTLDSSFNGDGKVIADFGGSDYGSSVAVQPDGKIVVCGRTEGTGGLDDFLVLRFNSDGTPDNTFSMDGAVTTDFDGGDDDGKSIAIQTDGKIVVGGSADISGTPHFAVARYNADGTHDLSFSGDGKAYLKVGDNSNVGESIAIQPDGKILLAGRATNNATNHDFALARFNSDGTADTDFGGNGFVNTEIAVVDYGQDMAMQPNGRIVVAGYSYVGVPSYDFVLVRYLSGLNIGILDLSREQGGLLVYPNPIQTNTIIEYELSEDQILSMDLYDLSGRQVQQFLTKQHKAKGKHKEQLHFEKSIPSGKYVLTISSPAGNVSIHIIKQ